MIVVVLQRLQNADIVYIRKTASDSKTHCECHSSTSLESAAAVGYREEEEEAAAAVVV